HPRRNRLPAPNPQPKKKRRVRKRDVSQKGNRGRKPNPLPLLQGLLQHQPQPGPPLRPRHHLNLRPPTAKRPRLATNLVLSPNPISKDYANPLPSCGVWVSSWAKFCTTGASSPYLTCSTTSPAATTISASPNRSTKSLTASRSRLLVRFGR